MKNAIPLIVCQGGKLHQRIEHILSKSSGDIFAKLLSIIALISIILSLYIIARSPYVDGYEISIYEAYPWKFWFFLILSASCGLSILVHQAFVAKKYGWWAGGFFIVLFVNLIIIILPIFRGYFISSSGDEISHLGMIKDIDLTGFVENFNVYPISHILSYEISSIIGIDFKFIIKIVPAIFYLIYMIGFYLLAKVICKDFGQILLIIAFNSGLPFTYFSYLFLPTQFFLYLVPFILSLFFRKTSSTNLGNPTIFMILLIMVPFLHPLGSVLLVVIFFLLALSVEICIILAKKLNIRGDTTFYTSEMALKPGAVLLIVFLAWFLNFAVFKYSIKKAYYWFAEGYGTPEVTKMAATFEMSGLSMLQLANLIIMTYGPSLILSFFSVVAIYAFFHRTFSHRSGLRVYEIFFSLFFFIICIFSISTLFGDFIHIGRSQRLFCWVVMASTIVNGLVFYELIASIKSKFNSAKRIIVYGSLLTVIVIIVILGMFSVYPSPYIMRSNFQVTEMDWAGMTWCFNHKNNDGIICFNEFPYRALDYLYGLNAANEKKFMWHFSEIPQNLGYNKNKSLANSIDSDSYIVINDQIRVSKEQLFPYLGKFTVDDINQMSHDFKIIKVYSSKGLDILRVLSENFKP